MSCQGCGFDRYDVDPHAHDCPTMRACVLEDADRCEYAAACTSEATTIIDAPALRDAFPYGVPACESCAALYEALS